MAKLLADADNMICSETSLYVIRAAGVLAGACDSNNTQKEGYKHHNNLVHRHLMSV